VPPIRAPILNPPFDIVRASYAVLNVQPIVAR
jgi:hypothetical protein